MSSEEQHFLSNTPVEVAIQSLQQQVEQLKRIVNKKVDDLPDTTNQEALKEEIKQLKIANEKAEYRIRFLLRTLEQKETSK
ncbi:hypothetical protein A0J61_09777 [Choanephora cucurbitarum]|uniref:Mediator of RNA polymerase II transcription subunit 9 n=2 Tax=Choanephora cucurbitarum TaxID=101091 RepID=A0A1C7MZC5_9FUNG|nr:hypothetical protein A0J61_09777 [Choanephora cucurbitarum]